MGNGPRQNTPFYQLQMSDRNVPRQSWPGDVVMSLLAGSRRVSVPDNADTTEQRTGQS